MNTLRSFKALVLAVLFVSLASFANAQSSGRWIGRIQVAPSSSGRSVASPNDVRQDADAAISQAPDRAGDVDIAAKKGTIVGSWLLTVNIPGNPAPFDSFNALWALTGDGILVSSAQGDTAPTPFPSNTSAYGAWAQTGDHKFAATFLSVLYDSQTGENMGRFKLLQTMTLNDAGDTWSGAFRLNVYDPDGNLVATVDGTAQAKRIVVETLQ